MVSAHMKRAPVSLPRWLFHPLESGSFVCRFFTGDEAFSDPQKSTPKADGIDGASRL